MRKFHQCLLLGVVIVVALFGGAGCTRKAKEARALKRAEEDYAQNDYDKAEIEYINVLRMDRGVRRAYVQLGKMYLEEGRLTHAFPYIRQSVKMDTNDYEMQSKLALCFLSAMEAREAREIVLYVLDHHPEDPDAPLILADAVVTLDDADAARQRLNKLNVPAAKRAPIETALGNLALREHDYRAAAAAYDRARAADPKFSPTYSGLGTLYETEKDLKHAEESLKYAADTASLRSVLHIRYAQFKVQHGDAEGGKKILDDLAKKAPDCILFDIALANFQANQKKYVEADKYASKALVRDPDNFEALMLGARLGLLEGNVTEAVARYEKLAKDYPKVPQLHYQLALAYSAGGDSAKAMGSLNQALTLNSNYVDADLALAQIKISKGDPSSAIITLKQTIQIHRQLLGQQSEKMLTAQLLLGQAYAQQGDIDNALLVFKQAKEAFPKSPEAALYRGQIYMRLGRTDEAHKEFDYCLAIAPDYAPALQALTDLEISEGNYVAAMERVQSAIKVDPNSPDLVEMVSKIYLAQNNVDQAVAVMQADLKAHPDFKAGYISLGNLYLQVGQPQKALETARAFLAKSPDDSAGLMLVATVLDSQKDVPGAERAYEQVLKVSPKNSAALNNLAYLYAEHGQADQAFDLARRAREMAPGDPLTGDTYGWVLYCKGDYSAAAVVLQQSADKGLNVPDIPYHLGMTRYMLGEEDHARAALQMALQTKQPFAGKDDATSALAVLAIDPSTAGADARATLEKRVAEKPADTVAQLRLASIHKREGNMDKAVAAYEAAIKANPQNARALMELAQIYAAQPNQTQKAYALAKNAYNHIPENVILERLLGRLAFQSGDYTVALSYLEDAAKKKQPDADMLYDLALAAYSVGRVSEAVGYAQNALQANPAFSHAADTKQFLATVALADNPAQAVAAEAQVSQTLKADPENVPALMASGVIAEQKSNPAAAKTTFEHVISKYPDFVPAKRHLAVLYGQIPGDEKHSLDVAFKAYEAYPNDTDVIEAVGIISYRLGDYAKASRFLKESDSKKPGDAQLEYYLGKTQYQLKQKVDSKKSLLRALDLKLQDPLATDAKKTLAELK